MERKSVKSVKGAKGVKRAGFTIVELLTVMSVILILMSLLVPALNSLRRFAYYVKQKNQFHGTDVALEFFNTEREGYPLSGEYDPTNIYPYCGDMKLAEAMVGQDMLGFNPLSKFYQIGTSDGVSPNNGIPSGPTTSGTPPGNDLYPARRGVSQTMITDSMKERNKLYLPLENANVHKLNDLYDEGLVNSFFPSISTPAENLPVLCDVYIKAVSRATGKNVGMPVLYYKANTNKHSHDYSTQIINKLKSGQTTDNIYNFMDNNILVCLGIPTSPPASPANPAHPMASEGSTSEGIAGDPTLFYKETLNKNASNVTTGFTQPYRAESYILMSAGFDGLYGTADDVFNFEK